MTTTFNCASCSAPLEFAGTTTQKCEFCGCTVIAPSELFYSASAGSPFGDISSLTGKALKIAEIQGLIHRGKKIEAIKEYRETFGCGLAEAKDAVEALERGESVQIGGARVQAKLSPEQVNAVKKVGYAVSGTILATILIISLITITGIGIAVYFAFAAAQPQTPAPGLPYAPVPKAPAAGKEVPKASGLTETARFGGEGTGAGRFKDNRSIAVDGSGRIYSGDYSDGKVQAFDAEGKFLSVVAPLGGNILLALAADRQGAVYVAHNRGISKYDGATGQLLAENKDVDANGLALTLSGEPVITAHKQLIFLDKNLAVVRKIENAAEQASSSFGFEAIAVDGNGTIFTLDRTGGDVCKFSRDGKFLNRFPSGARSPNDLALDPTGRLFVSDTSTIYALDENGRRLGTFEATQAFGLAFNDAGELFVASRPYVVKYNVNF